MVHSLKGLTGNVLDAARTSRHKIHLSIPPRCDASIIDQPQSALTALRQAHPQPLQVSAGHGTASSGVGAEASGCNFRSVGLLEKLIIIASRM
jgi:hypothetical protein